MLQTTRTMLASVLEVDPVSNGFLLETVIAVLGYAACGIILSC